jgi:uncharacterized protein with PQ loop repeat
MEAAAAPATAGSLPAGVVTFLQVAPPLAAQALFLAPMQVMRQIKEQKSTGDLPLLPYSAMVTSCSIWMTYGILADMNWSLIGANMSGFFFGAYYVSVFQKYKADGVSFLPHYLGSASLMAATASR